ncbi:hypothetical protein DEO72_LG6g489 [Vigna unguiculata]|uniref:Uncharacterized protein n=1 Tax=Vigna unguiculata TaxID=3917 RepID=A0A4D6M4U2_VIGUN|nr:hypothetical protein DEO72_LG6g489 [Vigna unguiculata]
MYPAIPGRNMVVMLPTCVLAEMYPAIPGRDVAVTLPTCVLAEMYQANLGWDVADLLPFWGDEASFPIDKDMGGSSRAMKLPFPLTQIWGDHLV